MTSLKSIAEQCGKDVSTVSRALRDDPRVKEGTREEIKALARDMGYTPNLAARSLRVGSTKTIWFLHRDLRNMLAQEALEHAAIAFREAGYDLLSAVYPDEDVLIRLLKRLEQGVCDGAVLVPGEQMALDQLNALAARDYPVAFLDRHLSGVEIPVFTTANDEAAFQLAQRCSAEADCILSLYGGNPVEMERSAGAARSAVKMGIPCYDHKAFKELQAEQLPKRLAIMASSQHEIPSFVNRNSQLLQGRELVFGVFDGWVGEPFPAGRVYVCKQDFEAMARAAVSFILDTIEAGGPVSFHTNYVPHRELTEVAPSQ